MHCISTNYAEKLMSLEFKIFVVTRTYSTKVNIQQARIEEGRTSLIVFIFWKSTELDEEGAAFAQTLLTRPLCIWRMDKVAD
jgi:hypothetical protein